MTEDERWKEVCSPALSRIRDDLDLLKKHLIIGNGKPSLLNRVDALEKAEAKPAKDNRVFSIGKLVVLRGYGANDVARIVVVLGVLWLVFGEKLQGLIK